MYTQEQENLLNIFADKSDILFELGVITTDSFTGEIGEYIACSHFKLSKTFRVTKSIDGICPLGKRYQIKSKVIQKNNFNYNILNLDLDSIDFLVIVYFDKEYLPIRLLRIPRTSLSSKNVLITNGLIKSKQIEVFENTQINIQSKEKAAIKEFAIAYNALIDNQIIRSRRIVGDIGEFYACRYLNLILSTNKIEKGFDAKHENGLTFEIKTRRVYSSGRRGSEKRRINGLDKKSADYLVVVVINRSFKCVGMWVMPMKNIINPQSAHLEIVNYTYGTLNVVPSSIHWLLTGEKLTNIDNLLRKDNHTNKTEFKNPILEPLIKSEKSNSQIEERAILQSIKDEKDKNRLMLKGCIRLIIVVIISLYLIGRYCA